MSATAAAPSKRTIVTVPIDHIHPDPFQPRIHPDSELADSIRSQGVLQILSVEELQVFDAICPDCDLTFAELNAIGNQYMIRDGERRWRGASAAGVKEVDVEVVAPLTSGKRLLRQVTFNAHKPLTPMELGLAYKSIMEEEKWTQVELAKELGIAKSTVGDRIRLVELDTVWLDLIEREKLQVSHAPMLHPYAAVPPQYQAAAAKQIIGEDWLGVSVDEFQFAAQDAFREFITPLSEVGSQYDGPVIEVKQFGTKRKFAADPDRWKPIVAEKAKRAKQAQAAQTTSPSRSSSPRAAAHPFDQFEDIPKRQAKGGYDYELAKGEIKVFDVHQGWSSTFLGLPAVFMAKVDRAKLVRVYFKHGGGVLVTTDTEAVAAARAAYAEELRKQVEPQIVELVASIEKNRPRFRIAGPGARALLESVEPWNSPLPMLARALNVKVEGLVTNDNKPRNLRIADVDADMLATAYVATRARAVKVIPEQDISMALWRKYTSAPLKFPAIKKSEKLADRVDFNALRAAVEAGTTAEATA